MTLRQRALSSRTVLLTLAALHVAMKIALLPRVLSSPLQGDEVAYNNSAKAIAIAIRDLVSGASLPVHLIKLDVVGNGWFMPGVSALLAPLYLVDPSAGYHAVRIYVGVVSLVLFLGGVYVTRRVLGARYAAALLVVPGLIPMWVLFTYTAWGDLLGGLLVVALVMLLLTMWRDLESGRSARLRHGVALGVLLALTLYLRSSALPLVVGALALAGIGVLVRARGRALVQSVVTCAVAAVVFGAIVAPWSIAVSKVFDHRVVTTTTLPISMGYAFGNTSELCFGPCPPGNPWTSMVSYSRAVAKQTGLSEVVVQKQMSDYAMRNVTPSSYAGDTLSDFRRYSLEPTGFAPIFTKSGTTNGFVSALIDAGTNVLYFAGLALAAISIVTVRRIPSINQLATLLSSLFLAALMMQPFVHICTARYWPVYAPMVGIAAAGLLVRRDKERSNRTLRLAGGIVACGWVVVIGGLFVVGA